MAGLAGLAAALRVLGCGVRGREALGCPRSPFLREAGDTDLDRVILVDILETGDERELLFTSEGNVSLFRRDSVWVSSTGRENTQ